jgi:hypothetical protein
VDFRHHRLREGPQGKHHLAAPAEQIPDEFSVGVGQHLLQVVPRAEGLARAREDDDADAAVHGNGGECRLQFRQHLAVDGVELLGAVESQRGHAACVRAQDERLDGCFQGSLHFVTP